jgi:nucleoside-diphosphate-sugar epimerase
MSTNQELHVVLGASGGIGNAILRELARQGKRIRGVTRSVRAEVPAGVELVAGDITNIETARAVCKDATVVYFCANPAYTRWPQDFPPLLEGAIKGATEAGAKLVVMDNLYVYAPTTQPMAEDLPWKPVTRKGRVRAAMDERLMAAHRSKQVRVAIGRASDFYGPGALHSTVAGDQLFKALFEQKTIQWIGRLDQPHTLSYIEDVARGLVTLGARDEALGQVWHLPAAESLTGQQFLDILFEEAGMRTRVTRTSPAMLRIVGMVNPIVHEIVEMAYEFEKPSLMDGSKFTHAFGGKPTSHHEAIRATVNWYKAHLLGVSSAY